MAQDCQLNVYKPNPRQYIASISQVTAPVPFLPKNIARLQPHVLYSVIETLSQLLQFCQPPELHSATSTCVPGSWDCMGSG